MHVAVINTDNTTFVTRDTIPPSLAVMQEAVKGYIEQVPYFTSFEYDGKRYHAVAFCNEEGKLSGMDVNIQATLAWASSLHVDHGFPMDDVLCGPVMVLFTDNAADLEDL